MSGLRHTRPSRALTSVQHNRVNAVGARLATAGAAALLIGALAATSADALVCSTGRRASLQCTITYNFKTINDNKDNTFNQLLAINKNGVIAGYFGSGAAGKPNQGYVLSPNYGQGNFTDTNYPKSVQTQVTGINNSGAVVGFWSTKNDANMGNNDNFGFYESGGQFHNVNNPNTGSTPPVNQLLGINNTGTAVGFYNDTAGNAHGYFYNTSSAAFKNIRVPSGTTSDTAAGVNDARDIAGFATINGTTEGFLIHAGNFMPIMFPGSDMTQALGVDNADRVVGVYQMGMNNGTAILHGFTWKMQSINGSTNQQPVFQTVDDPMAGGMQTTVNGIDSCGNLVGFYVDGQGNTNGMLATVPSGTSGAATDIQTDRSKKKKKHHSGKC
ncbi:MAG: hypothetical protein ACYDHH_06780 [Solirubrobacteraceae bacterium]